SATPQPSTAAPEPEAVSRWERRWARVRDRSGREAPTYPELRRQLQATMWQKLGIVRDADRLAEGLGEVRALRAELGRHEPADVRELLLHHELESSLLVAECCFGAALRREESRGAHYRLDFPERDDARWLRTIRIRLGTSGRPELETGDQLS